MNIKAVIYTKRRVPIIFYPKKKQLAEGKFERDNGTYFITDDDTFQITKRWIGPFRFQYVTYYYNEDCPVPLDFFNLVDTEEKYEEEIEVETEDGTVETKTVEHAVKALPYKRLTPQLLNELFNPAFYRMVRGTSKNAKQDMMYYLTWASALLAAYIAWRTTGIWNIVKDLIPNA